MPLIDETATYLIGSTRAAQASRLRRTLRELTEVDDLLTRLRDRTRVRTFAAHRAAVPRLRALVATSDLRRLGISGALDDDHVDGYLAEGELEDAVASLSLRPDPRGGVTLRLTGFDVERVRELVDTPVVAALDASTSTDPRLGGAGRRMLGELLEAYR